MEQLEVKEHLGGAMEWLPDKGLGEIANTLAKIFNVTW